MRLVLIVLTPLMTAALATPAPTPVPAPAPVPQLTQRGDAGRQNCRGKIEQVRQERGLPKLDRGNAGDDNPMAILAVDRQIAGCDVLVMKNNTSDIRPLPEFSDAPPRMQPLR
jgi:hypothetical protein